MLFLYFLEHITARIDRTLDGDSDEKSVSPSVKRIRCVSQFLWVASMHVPYFFYSFLLRVKPWCLLVAANLDQSWLHRSNRDKATFEHYSHTSVIFVELSHTTMNTRLQQGRSYRVLWGRAVAARVLACLRAASRCTHARSTNSKFTPPQILTS